MDATTHAELRSFSRKNEGLAVDPASNRIYVVDPSTDKVYVHDWNTGALLFSFGSTGSPRMNAVWTAFGAPAISVPTAGFPPVGLQIAAAPGNDAALLAFAAADGRM